jgi:hypothetical protein
MSLSFDKETAENRLNRMQNYLEEIPKQYRPVVLPDLMYSENISFSHRKALIRQELADLKPTDRQYAKNYLSLMQVYFILLAQRNDKFTKKLKEASLKRRGLTSKVKEAWAENIRAQLALVDLVDRYLLHTLQVEGDNREYSSNDPLLKFFKAKMSPDKLDKHLRTNTFFTLLVQMVDLLYWARKALPRSYEKDPNFQMIIQGLDLKASAILDKAKGLNHNWAGNDDLFRIDFRMDLEKAKNLAKETNANNKKILEELYGMKSQDIIAMLKKRQNIALSFNNIRSYVHLRELEAIFYDILYEGRKPLPIKAKLRNILEKDRYINMEQNGQYVFPYIRESIESVIVNK